MGFGVRPVLEPRCAIHRLYGQRRAIEMLCASIPHCKMGTIPVSLRDVRISYKYLALTWAQLLINGNVATSLALLLLLL